MAKVLAFYVWFFGALTIWSEGADLWPKYLTRAVCAATWPLAAPFLITANMVQQEREHRAEKARRAEATEPELRD